VTGVELSPITMKVHPADMRDRDGAPDVIEAAPTPARFVADGGRSGPKPQTRLRQAGLSGHLTEVVDKPRDANGFAVPPRRRIVERTFARTGCRRLAKDWEPPCRELPGLAPARRLPVSASQDCGIGMTLA